MRACVFVTAGRLEGRLATVARSALRVCRVGQECGSGSGRRIRRIRRRIRGGDRPPWCGALSHVHTLLEPLGGGLVDHLTIQWERGTQRSKRSLISLRNFVPARLCAKQTEAPTLRRIHTSKANQGPPTRRVISRDLPSCDPDHPPTHPQAARALPPR